MNDTTKTKYKRHDEAFKRQAVEHWLISGLPGRQIAAELGINEQSLKGLEAAVQGPASGPSGPDSGCPPSREPPPPTRTAPGAGAAGHS